MDKRSWTELLDQILLCAEVRFIDGFVVVLRRLAWDADSGDQEAADEIERCLERAVSD